jgi:hypothetical protein
MSRDTTTAAPRATRGVPRATHATRLPVVVALLLAALVAVLAPASSSRADADAARRAQALIAGLDYDQAQVQLAAADPQDPSVAIERARLAIYELDCDGAVAILARADLQKTDAGAQLGDIARGCQRVTAAIVTDEDAPRGIEVRWQDEHDRALAPLLFETVALARDALTRDLGADWPRPTRIVVVRDLLSLSAMTGLPYASAKTTGTLAVAKWGRITLLSPRASRHGYAWRDTVAHELTHLAVTRASGDRAPLWLQEGIAKREEPRWREPGPFDERPPSDAVVRRGEELKLDLPLDRLGPSIAMLPSADAAMVAYAEVKSFVGFYAGAAGDHALPMLLAALKSGKDPDQALLAASGSDLKGWDARWRTDLAARPGEPLSPLFGLGGEGGDGTHGGAGARGERDRWTEVRDRSRLADLLMARGHADAALDELDPIAAAGSAMAGDPSLRWLRARALEAAGAHGAPVPAGQAGAPSRPGLLGEAESLVSDPKAVVTSFAPWWAVRARWARLRGDEDEAIGSYGESLAADPYEPEAACETIDPASRPDGGEKASLCDAARAAAGPTFGQD